MYVQLEKCQKECEVLSRELRRKDSELEALQQESKFELNKVGTVTRTVSLLLAHICVHTCRVRLF